MDLLRPVNSARGAAPGSRYRATHWIATGAAAGLLALSACWLVGRHGEYVHHREQLAQAESDWAHWDELRSEVVSFQKVKTGVAEDLAAGRVNLAQATAVLEEAVAGMSSHPYHIVRERFHAAWSATNERAFLAAMAVRSAALHLERNGHRHSPRLTQMLAEYESLFARPVPGFLLRNDWTWNTAQHEGEADAVVATRPRRG